MRALSYNLEQALSTGTRRPAFKLYAFDPALDTMTEIITETYSQTPLELTGYIAPEMNQRGYVSDISWGPGQISFTLADPQGLFHPDTGAQKTYLADKAIIRLRQGDERVAEADWIWIFTGQVHGQIGWSLSRRSQTMEAKVTAYGRENNQAYKRRTCTSAIFTVGTEIGFMLRAVAQDFLGLDPAEIRVPPILGLQLLHNTNQLAQVTPWDGITAILETVGRSAYFDGDGRLTCLNKNMQRLPDKYLTAEKILDYQVPARNQDTINKVRVIFLDSALTRVDGPPQKLGTASATSGFFSPGENLECWWSEDRKQRAAGTYMRVLKSINSGILPVGSESYSPVDEFHGVIRVSVDQWVSVALIAMIMVWVGAHAIPDGVATIGVGASGGTTIPIGRILEGAAMLVIMLIMMSLGTAQYEIWGTPYDYAYLERYHEAVQDGLEYWEENKKEIKNDFLGSMEQAQALAVVEWIWEASQACPRQLLIEDDPSLEIGDIVVMPDGRKFLIGNLKKDIRRGAVPVLSLDGYKVLAA